MTLAERHFGWESTNKNGLLLWLILRSRVAFSASSWFGNKGKFAEVLQALTSLAQLLQKLWFSCLEWLLPTMGQNSVVWGLDFKTDRCFILTWLVEKIPLAQLLETEEIMDRKGELACLHKRKARRLFPQMSRLSEVALEIEGHSISSSSSPV